MVEAKDTQRELENNSRHPENLTENRQSQLTLFYGVHEGGVDVNENDE
jgi:hypothetical protein